MEKDQGDNPDNALVRYEFIELLVRIAREKYMRPPSEMKYDEAFEKLMNDIILPAS